MKKGSILFPICAFMLFLASLSISCANTAPSTGPVILRLVMEPGIEDNMTKETMAMAERFFERTGGEYQIEVVTGQTLLKTPEYLDGVRSGAVEMMDIGFGIYSGADARLATIETPFLFDNVQAAASCSDMYPELLDPILTEKFNQKVLSTYTNGGFELISTKPITKLEDWQGLMLGAVNPPMAGLAQVLGGSPIIVMWVDMYSNLEKGVIDATLLPTEGVLQARLTDVVSNATIFYGCSGFMGYTINLDMWESMDNKTQKILTEETIKTCSMLNERSIERHDEDIAQLESLGINVYILPDAERDRWTEKCQPLIDEQISSVGDFGNEIKKMADQANTEVK
jgi:TRAP-type C4-dicarboxylate transport system substrate-binding protein